MKNSDLAMGSTRLVRLSLFVGTWFAAMNGLAAEHPGTKDGQWHYLGGDSEHTRYSPADQINASNFNDLEETWVWDGASFNAQSGRSTPSYINGVLYTVAGPRPYPCMH